MSAREPEPDGWLLTGEEWERLRAAARELDLVHQGYFRLRPRAIAVFCGPGNQPAGWDLPFTDGSPDLPRQYVGEFEVGPAVEGAVLVRLGVANWAAVRAVKEAYERGDYRGRYREFVRDQQTALQGRPEDRAWLRRQFERLRAHAGGLVVAE